MLAIVLSIYVDHLINPHNSLCGRYYYQTYFKMRKQKLREVRLFSKGHRLVEELGLGFMPGQPDSSPGSEPLPRGLGICFCS